MTFWELAVADRGRASANWDTAATITAAVCNSSINRRKGGKAFTPYDFHPLENGKAEDSGGINSIEEARKAFQSWQGSPAG